MRAYQSDDGRVLYIILPAAPREKSGPAYEKYLEDKRQLEEIERQWATQN